MNDDIFFPLVIAAGMFAVVYAGVSMGEFQGHAFHSKCIEECYEDIKDRRKAAKLALLEQDKLIAAGVIEAPVIVKDLKPPTWGGCAGCHGQKGEGMGMFPKISGQSKDYIITALTQYKNKEKRGSKSMIMWGQASGLSGSDINTLGEYISTL
jgi:cytochrome c553